MKGVIFLFSLIILLLIYKLFKNKQTAQIEDALQNSNLKSNPLNAESVRTFYNETTEKFRKVYGDIIQAFRTKNVEDYLDYTIKSADLKDGQTILDAGCGIGGPSKYFASKLDIQIEACTISDYQAEMGKKLIEEAQLQDKVHIQRADYHDMAKIYPKDHFDRVIFLESFGHSPDKKMLIEAAWEVLKPGGFLYIKDLFEREAGGDEDMKKIKEICEEINKAYHYAIADLHEIISIVRKKGFIFTSVKTPEVDMDLFEHLTISNDFQNLFDISKINSWENYIFPIDFLEIKVQKPPFMIDFNKHLYHMNQPEAQ
ncbi:MAG: class I SAM-dependent methyltransferase [Chitinophagales bacterium]|nr:class I SAM-dependent methyltransferase [Chitinophagales bacterium]